MSLRVLIIGGGLGGLCLAQGLRKANIEVRVYERESAVSSRGQGYRLRIDSDGDTALRACLPESLYALYRATGSSSNPPVGAFDCHLNLIYRLPREKSDESAPPHLSVNRLTLRQILLGGLEEAVQFDHTLISFDQTEKDVQAHFTDGRTATGDVLIAADGIHSAIRRQLLPEAEIADTGMGCVYGKTILTPELLRELPETVLGGFTPCLGRERRTLALGRFQATVPPVEAAAADHLAPFVPLDPVPDYLMWLFVAPQKAFPPTETHADSLHRRVLAEINDWHPALRLVLEQADVPSVVQTPIRSARPVPPWPSSRVTLLGDAIHAMTPAGGIGANTALRDAALLARTLSGAAKNPARLIAAIASYETEMRVYGFAAVERSLHAAAPLYRVSVPAPEIVP